MAGYQGNGTFAFTYNWVNDAANGIPITASRMDGQFNDAVSGFDLVICRDGQSTIAADIPWNGFRLTGLGAATTAGDALSYGGAAVLAASIITSTSANAFDVGPNGATNPVLQVDASTSSAATGLKLKAAAAAAGFALSVLSSGTDENLTIDAKGAGTLTLNGTATGNIVAPRLLDISGAAANQIKFGAAGTNPSSNVNTLDAYQEGTFTFIDNSGQSVPITNTYCKYVLIGKTCFISVTAVFGTSVVATPATWNGLPFTVKNAAGNGGAAVVYGRANTAIFPQINDTYINWVSTAGSTVNDSDLSGLALRFQFSYEIA